MSRAGLWCWPAVVPAAAIQVGVWRALMELDWHPQIITGTSVGSLNGAMFVLDQYETARDMWLSIRSKDVMELPERMPTSRPCTSSCAVW